MSTVAIAVAGLCILFAASLALGALLLRQAPMPGRRAFLIGCAGLAIWSASLVIQFTSTDPHVKRVLAGGVYLGICASVLGMSRCVLELAGRLSIPRWVWGALCVPGVVTPVLAATGWHNLLLATVDAPAAMGPTHSTSGPWFFLHTVWAYGLLVGSLLVFVVVAQGAPAPLRRQAHLLAAAVGGPLLVNVVFVSGLVPTGDYDPTPFTLIVSLAGLAWGLRGARLLDGRIGTVTVARDLVVEAMRDPVLTLDRDGRLLDLNPAARALAGGEGLPLGTPVSDFLPDWPTGDAAGEESFTHDGRTFDVAFTALPGRRQHDVRIAVLRDSTRRERAEQSTRERADLSDHRARHDDLTGLPNRSALFSALGDQLRKEPDRPFALLVLDLDGFKALNDSFGHRAGDDVLRTLSHRLVTAAGAETLVTRLGGDEFAVMVDLPDPQDVQVVAQRIVDAVRVPFTVGDADVRLGGSVGIALAPRHGTTPDSIVYAADVAMYEAKRERHGVSVYAPTQGQRRPGHLQLSSELRSAVERGEIDVHYQPQRDPAGNLVGLEALARWEHPRRRLLMPAQFLPLAEESSLICELTDLVVARALSDATRWRVEGVAARVSVNLSERDMRDPRLVRRISDALESQATDPDGLTLEVTENALGTAPDTARHLHTLREMGVRLSLDDFGTGFAPMSNLRRLDVDEIKIDRTFVSGMTKRDAALVQALLNFGHDLGLLVVAEGVENDAEQLLLARLQCDVLQGYFLGRPVPLDAVDFSRLGGAVTPAMPPGGAA